MPILIHQNNYSEFQQRKLNFDRINLRTLIPNYKDGLQQRMYALILN